MSDTSLPVEPITAVQQLLAVGDLLDRDPSRALRFVARSYRAELLRTWAVLETAEARVHE